MRMQRKAAKRFSRNPSSAFSFAEGTRFTSEKHSAQELYSNLLKPKVGARYCFIRNASSKYID